PGDKNSLGAIRINFPSKDGVYMHDTPLKNLFGEDMRFHSSGCVRVENIRGLVDWLLRDTAGWARPQMFSTRTQPEEWKRMSSPNRFFSGVSCMYTPSLLGKLMRIAPSEFLSPGSCRNMKAVASFEYQLICEGASSWPRMSKMRMRFFSR